jgi:hypothetical protein
MTTHRVEALRAIEHAETRLSAPEPIDALAKKQLLATLQHAAEEVRAIAEVKRVRRPKPAPEGGTV